MTMGDIIVLSVLGLVICGILVRQLRRKKTGSHCGCGSCQGCAMAGKCHQDVNEA